MESLDVTTVVFAIVAILVIFKLRSVLGTRTGAERRPPEGEPPTIIPPRRSRFVFGGARNWTAPPPPPPAPDRWKPYAEAGTPLAAGLDAIAAGEPQFDPTAFLSGARSAYDMIVAAFAAGDLDTLRRMLAPDVFANFSAAINARGAAKQTVSTTVVSIDKADFVDARVEGRIASLAVRFETKLVSSTSDASGKVIEGSATAVGDNIDVWTFSRALGAPDPNWQLTATQTVH